MWHGLCAMCTCTQLLNSVTVASFFAFLTLIGRLSCPLIVQLTVYLRCQGVLYLWLRDTLICLVCRPPYSNRSIHPAAGQRRRQRHPRAGRPDAPRHSRRCTRQQRHRGERGSSRGGSGGSGGGSSGAAAARAHAEVESGHGGR